MEKNLVLIDSHPLVHYGLESLCNEHGYRLVKGYGERDDRYTIILRHKPEFIIIDIHQPSVQGAEFLHVANTLGIKDKVIVFTEYDHTHYQKECLSAGINAYIPKYLDSSEIIRAMAALKKGERYYPVLGKKQSTKQIVDFDSFIKSSLTRREQLVLKKLSAGYSNKEISNELHLSTKTISTYKNNLLEKLGADSLIHAVDIARLHAVP
jgi:two-component system response regulator EvgA